jgi:TRAP-type C4-dicarboxylate transport system substrate-binding protein
LLSSEDGRILSSNNSGKCRDHGEETMIQRISAVLVAAMAAGAAVPASAQTVELKLSHFVPPNHAFHKWATAWGEQLAKESDGRLKLTIYPNGQLVGPPNRQLDAARNAVTDISFVLHGVTPGRYAVTELANLPFTWPKAGSGSAVTSRRLAELGPQYLAAEHQGLKILWMAVANPVVFYSKQPVRSLDGFKGMKVRYSGVQTRSLLDTLGAVPMLVPPSDSQDALAKGIVDSALFPHEAALSYDLGSVAKFAIEPGVAANTFVLAMNPARYNALPADLKAIIDKSTGPDAAERFGKEWEAAERHGREREIAAGVQIITLSDADIAKMKTMMAAHVEAAIGALEKDGKPARRFYDEYIK